VAAEYTAEAVYGVIRPRWRRTGATEDETRRPLPGDELVPKANYVVTRAESISAAPEDVWPWLVQMGYSRGGYYGDFPWWRDPDRHRGARSSADAVLPRFQQLRLGDVLLDAPHCDERLRAWRVRVLEPGHALALFSSRTPLSGREVTFLPPRPRAFFDCSWAFVLVSKDGGTRLLVRSRIRMQPGWLLQLACVIRGGGQRHAAGPAGRHQAPRRTVEPTAGTGTSNRPHRRPTNPPHRDSAERACPQSEVPGTVALCRTRSAAHARARSASPVLSGPSPLSWTKKPSGSAMTS
jgi:hypothetical protein